MKLNIYSIYDTASGTYLRPFFTGADGDAARSFSDLAIDAEHQIGKHPADYTLFRLGSFNDNTGKIEGETPEKIATALECIAASRTVNKNQMSLLDEGIKNGTA